MAKKNKTENTAPAPAAAPAAPTAPAADAAPAEPKKRGSSLPQQNGVSRPKPGGKTGTVWEVSDRISAEKQSPAPRKDVMDACKAMGINEATIATQYGRWRKFNGLKRELPPKPAAAAPAPAADVTVQQ
jgi:hypothetical protein